MDHLESWLTVNFEREIRGQFLNEFGEVPDAVDASAKETVFAAPESPVSTFER
jgi:hypothetical protein